MDEKYLYNGKVYQRSQLESLAKQSNVSFNEYVSGIGAKPYKENTTTKSNGSEKFVYNGKDYSREQINELATQSNVSFDEYIKGVGVKKKDGITPLSDGTAETPPSPSPLKSTLGSTKSAFSDPFAFLNKQEEAPLLPVQKNKVATAAPTIATNLNDPKDFQEKMFGVNKFGNKTLRIDKGRIVNGVEEPQELEIDPRTIPYSPYKNVTDDVFLGTVRFKMINNQPLNKQEQAFLDKNKRPMSTFGIDDDNELGLLSKANGLDMTAISGVRIPDMIGNLFPQVKGKTFGEVGNTPEGKYTQIQAVKLKLQNELQQAQNVTTGATGQMKDEQKIASLKEQLEELDILEVKASKGLTTVSKETAQGTIRTDNTGNNFNRFLSSLQDLAELGVNVALKTVMPAVGAIIPEGSKPEVDKDIELKVEQLPSQLFTALNFLKYKEPVEFARVTRLIAEGKPISATQVANLTNIGIEIEKEKLKEDYNLQVIDKTTYDKNNLELSQKAYENLVGNKEVLRGLLSSGIADYLDEIESSKIQKNISGSREFGQVFGMRWQYTDEEIEYAAKAVAKAEGLNIDDPRVKEQIQYLKDNEGAMIMQNSIYKSGFTRDFFRGAAMPIRGIASTIEGIGKTSEEIYAEGQSQGNVNVSETPVKRIANSWEGTVGKVFEGAGQLGTQIGLSYLTGGAIGGAGKAILGRGGVAALEGEIALADMAVSDLAGAGLYKGREFISTFMTSFGTTYDGKLKEAQTYTADDGKAMAVAGGLAGMEGVVETFLSPLDIARGVGKGLFGKSSTQKLINILDDAKILDKKSAIQEYLNGTLKAGLAGGKMIASEIGEEEVIALSSYGANAMLNPNSESFQNRVLKDELFETGIQTGLSMVIPALFTGVGAFNTNTFAKGSLIIAAQNRQMMVDALDKNLADGSVTQEDYNKKLQIVNSAAKANEELPLKADGVKLNSEEKADYIYSRVSEGALERKMEVSNDAAEKAIIQEKITEQQKFRESILKTPTNVQSQTTENVSPQTQNNEGEQGQNNQAENAPNAQDAEIVIDEPTLQTVRDNAEGVTMGIYKNIFQTGDAITVSQALKEVSDQWHDTRSQESAERTFGKGIVDLAKSIYPQELNDGVTINTNKTNDNENQKSNTESLLGGVREEGNQDEGGQDGEQLRQEEGQVVGEPESITQPIELEPFDTSNSTQSEIDRLREEEQKELAAAIPNIESYKVDGKVDKTLITDPTELATYNEIFDRYDGLITPLLQSLENKNEPTPAVSEPIVEREKEKQSLKEQPKAETKGDGGNSVGGDVKIKYGGKDKDLKGNPQKQWMKPTETSEQATNRLAEFVEASDYKGREQSAFIDRNGESIEVKLRNDDGKWNWYEPKSKKPFASFDNAKYAIKFIQEQPFWDNGELNKDGRNDFYFDKVKSDHIRTELENGNILEDINDGKISAKDAAKIIESAGLKVPKDIAEQSLKETPQAVNNEPTPAVSEPLQQNEGATPQQGGQEAVQQGTNDVGQGTSTSTPTIRPTVKRLASDGTELVTLSGLTEEERQERIAERRKQTGVSERVIEEQALLDDIKSYEGLMNGNRGKTSPQGLVKLNRIRNRIADYNRKYNSKYRFDDRRGVLRGNTGKSVKRIAIDSEKAIVDGQVLSDRSPKTQKIFQELFSASAMPTAYTAYGTRMSAAQLDGVIEDIVDGIPSRRAINYLNSLERQIEENDFDFSKSGSESQESRPKTPLSFVLDTEFEFVGEPMTQEALESWLADEAELELEFEQIVTDNIDNLITDYEQEGTTTANEEPIPTTETKSSGQPKQDSKEGAKGKADNADETIDSVSKKSGISPKNFRDMYNINRTLFGQDRIKAFASAIVMDRMVGAMAKRAGVSKAEMYGKIEFKKDVEENILKKDNALFQGIIEGDAVTLRNMDVDVVNGFYSPLEKIIGETKFAEQNISLRAELNKVQKQLQDYYQAAKKGIAVELPDGVFAEKALKEQAAKLKEQIANSETKTDNFSLSIADWKAKFNESEEAKWTGLTDWLAQQQGSVSKADIQKYLKENRIQIVEVVKEEGSKSQATKRFDEIIDILALRGYDISVEDYASSEMNVRGMDNGVTFLEERNGGFTNEQLISDGYVLKETHDEDVKLLEEAQKEAGRIRNLQQKDDNIFGTKFSQYQLEGEKENYKEVLVTLPETKKEVLSKDEWNELSKLEQNSIISEEDRIRLNKLRQKKNLAERENAKSKFKSSHFDEPNILVHLRMNTRTDAQGNKILFLEELQSDYAQIGRKEGFKEADFKWDTQLGKDAVVVLKKMNETAGFSDWKGLATAMTKSNDILNDFQVPYDSKDLMLKWHSAVNQERKVPLAPFVTDTNAWTKLGLKVALKEAIAQGATKIAWSTGTQQFERWGSEKIDWVKGGTKDRFNIVPYNGKWVVKDKNRPTAIILPFNSKSLAEQYIDKRKNETWTISVKEQTTATAFDGINIDEKALSESDISVSTKDDLRKIIDKNLKRERNDAEIDKLTDRIWKRMQTEDSGTSLPRKEGMEGFYGNPTDGSIGIVGGVAEKLFGQKVGTVEIDMGNDTESKGTSKFNAWMQKQPTFETRNDISKKEFGTEWINTDDQGHIETVNRIYNKQTKRFQDEYLKTYDSTSTQHSIDITPELKAQVQQGLALFQKEQGQKAKGAMVAADGGYIIYALTNPNLSTPVHEMAHVFEHYLTPEEKAEIQSWAKTNGWTRATSEKFARGFEKYLAEGKAPTKGLQKLFDKFKGWLTEIYNGITGSEIDIELSPKMTEIYSKVLGVEPVIKSKPTPPLTKEKKIEAFNKKADANAKALIDFLTPKGMAGVKKSGLGVEEIVNGANKAIKDAYAISQNVKDAVQKGLDYFIDNWNENELGVLPVEELRAKLEADLSDGIEVDANEGIGITHAATAETLNEFALPEYKKDAETFAKWDAEATERIKNGEMPALIEKLKNYLEASPVEVRMLGMYIANLKEVASRTKSDVDIAKMYEAIKLSDSLGSKEGKSLVARRGLFMNGDTLADYFQEEMDAVGVDVLTEEQKTEIEKEYEAINQAKEEWEKERERLNKKILEFEAQAEVNRQAKEAAKKGKSTKSTEDFSKERQKIVGDIREKLKKARSGTNATIVPYANELFAIAPDVAKLVKSLVEQGLVTLTDLVSEVKANLIDEIPQITDSDVRDLISGAYNEKKQTKSQLAKEIFDLKEEARLTNKWAALQAGELPKTEKGKIERNKQIKELREKIEKFRRDNPTDKESLDAIKKSYETRIKKLEDDLRTGNFLQNPVVKPPVKLDKEAIEAKDKLIKLKNERKLRILKAEYDNRTGFQKKTDLAADILNIPRALMTTLDLSAVLRQGIIPTVSGLLSTNPARITSAIKQMFKSAISQKEYDRWFSDLEESPNYELMIESGLALTDNNNPALRVREEAFMSNIVSKYVPLVKGSERAYSAYLNKLRVDMFNGLASSMEERGLTFDNNEEAYKQMAKYVNNATGRGGLPKVAGGDLNTISPLLNGLFFSPRLISSRLNMLTYFAQKRFYDKVPKEVRVAYFSDMVKFIGTGVGVLFLASLAGGGDDEEEKVTVEFDPRSSDFAKIRSGDTRWDIWGGFQPYVRLVSQVITNKRKSTSSGTIIDMGAEGIFNTTKGEQILSFTRGKLSPVPSIAVDFFSGRTAAGDKIIYDLDPKERSNQITIGKYTLQHLLPLTITGTYEAVKEDGVSSLLTVGLPNIFGIGTQKYGDTEIKILDDLPKVGEKGLQRLEEKGIEKLDDLRKYKGRLKTLKYKDDDGKEKRIFTNPQVKSIDSIFSIKPKVKN